MLRGNIDKSLTIQICDKEICSRRSDPRWPTLGAVGLYDSNEVPEWSQALPWLSIKTRKQEQPVPHEENRLSRVTKSA
jgi:hypothetical protein